MTINLPENLESSIREAVQSGQFASVDEAVAEAVRLLLRQRREAGPHRPDEADNPAAPSPEPAWKRVLQNMDAVPDDVFDRIPADSSEQLDHYLYGTPKRTGA
jgi:Arc/MetJ-type ribon-helix-helix transcriptional regulator